MKSFPSKRRQRFPRVGPAVPRNFRNFRDVLVCRRFAFLRASGRERERDMVVELYIEARRGKRSACERRGEAHVGDVLMSAVRFDFG